MNCTKMKRSISTVILYCGLLLSCNENTVLSFMPKTNVITVKNEFSVERDALRILGDDRNFFSINPVGIYCRIYKGKRSSLNSFSEKWTASFDENKQVLIENRKRKILSFQPSHMLFGGTSSYNKISGK